jgi:hypothetical protein
LCTTHGTTMVERRLAQHDVGVENGNPMPTTIGQIVPSVVPVAQSSASLKGSKASRTASQSQPPPSHSFAKYSEALTI